ncbi:zinc ABC transporter substrate-binding protein [Candidatus Parabeggiatoa sp. HSG14]|uniref:zinc ABC transporter substrate-binding protein n=1 Tax=Candidatus Parabeggiatoa sp. HSG14 TaxID=3055593 RepID=UPI0025A7AFBE|nr:zinc ABC transporter substrate-binding protein [Thiotrichales bacterium HSG14]
MLKYFILGLSMLTFTVSAYDAPPQVMVTIKPIHALVSGVMAGVDKPLMLLRGGESPHNYSLRPSQVRQLHAANLVIWVSPNVETFLEKIISTLSSKTQILRLVDVPDLMLLKIREGGIWKTHRHSDFHHTQDTQDPHIWLDPRNAKVIVQAVAHSLSQIDRKNASHYMANATRLIKQLEQLDQELQYQLMPIKHIPFLVFHDAFQYFEHRYELNAVGSISLSPETRLSVKRLYQLRHHLKKQQVRCVFSEPQLESTLITTLIENTSVQRGILDPLGMELTPGKEAYFTLLRNLVKSITQCLMTN